MVLDLGTSTANLAFESVPLASDTKVRVFFVDISFWLLKSLLIPLHLPPPLSKKKIVSQNIEVLLQYNYVSMGLSAPSSHSPHTAVWKGKCCHGSIDSFLPSLDLVSPCPRSRLQWCGCVTWDQTGRKKLTVRKKQRCLNGDHPWLRRHTEGLPLAPV